MVMYKKIEARHIRVGMLIKLPKQSQFLHVRVQPQFFSDVASVPTTDINHGTRYTHDIKLDTKVRYYGEFKPYKS